MAIQEVFNCFIDNEYRVFHWTTISNQILCRVMLGKKTILFSYVLKCHGKGRKRNWYGMQRKVIPQGIT
jgi:hypothetical protein